MYSKCSFLKRYPTHWLFSNWEIRNFANQHNEYIAWWVVNWELEQVQNIIFPGDDDSLNNSRAPSQENVNQSESVTTSQSDLETLISESATISATTEPEISQFSRTSNTRDPDSDEKAPQDTNHRDNFSESRVLESSGSFSTETLDASSDNVTGDDTNELRRKRLAFYDKSDNSASNTESQDDHSHISCDPSPTPSGGGIPVDGSSVDGNSQTVNRDTSTESAQTNSGSVPTAEMRIKIKYLDDRQRQVEAKPTETIGEFKRYFIQS